MYKKDLKNILNNNNPNYIKIIQGSTALKSYNLLKRKNNDIDLLIFNKYDIRVSHLNSLFFNDIKHIQGIIIEKNLGFYAKFLIPEIDDVNIEAIFVKTINENWYQKLRKSY